MIDKPFSMLNIEKAIQEKLPDLNDKSGAKILINLIKTLVHEEEINNFIRFNQHLRGFAFLDEVLKHFNFSYHINARDLNNIPAEGPIIVIANHPIGSLDGLALLKLIRSIRADVRIVANNLLAQIDPLRSLFIEVDNTSKRSSHKMQYKRMIKALEKKEAVIFFPAGEVSRIRPTGVRDGKWTTGFLKLAKKTGAAILPIHVNARNSALFYSLSALYKPFGTMLLVQEMFNKHDQSIDFHIGKPIPWNAVARLEMPNKVLAQRFRKHLYQLNKPKKHAKSPLFETIETVAHPIDRRALKKALWQSELLRETRDGKRIYLVDYQEDSPIMHEIGRLRELTFRTVEEGTGLHLDLDRFDNYYRHIVLWDEDELEIVGAYRIGECRSILPEKGLEGLYTHSLFELNSQFAQYLPCAIELGRSFVQPRYWGRRSLDYLWYGIGAYLARNSWVQFMFGPVSLSNAYPEHAKALIVGFYQTQFASGKHLATARHPYRLSQNMLDHAAENFGGDYKSSFIRLNKSLKNEGVKVPTLYKQYAEICHEGGCQFIDFNIDPDFNDCVDSLIIVDIKKMKEQNKEKYPIASSAIF